MLPKLSIRGCLVLLSVSICMAGAIRYIGDDIGDMKIIDIIDMPGYKCCYVHISMHSCNKTYIGASFNPSTPYEEEYIGNGMYLKADSSDSYCYYYADKDFAFNFSRDQLKELAIQCRKKLNLTWFDEKCLTTFMNYIDKNLLQTGQRFDQGRIRALLDSVTTTTSTTTSTTTTTTTTTMPTTITTTTTIPTTTTEITIVPSTILSTTTAATTNIPALKEKPASSVTKWRESTKNGSLECFDSYGCARARITTSSDAESCVITIKFNKKCETIDVFYSLLPNGAFNKWTPVADYITGVRECWHDDCQLNKCIFFTQQSKLFNGTIEEVENLVSLCALLPPLKMGKDGRMAPKLNKFCQSKITSTADNMLFKEGKKFNRRDVDVAFGREPTSTGNEIGMMCLIILLCTFFLIQE